MYLNNAKKINSEGKSTIEERILNKTK